MFVLNQKDHKEPCHEVRSQRPAECISEIQMRQLLILGKPDIPFEAFNFFFRLNHSTNFKHCYAMKSVSTQGRVYFEDMTTFSQII